MRGCQSLAVLVMLVGLVGCARAPSVADRTELSATAASTTDCCGNIVDREPTAEELAQLADIRARGEAVDRRFPPGVAPSGTQPAKGARILPTGELILVDGRTLTLDGASCSQQGYEYLSRFFLEPTASLLVVETGPAVSGKIPAEVWVVEPLGAGTSTSFPVEAGISTGWCDAKRSSTSPHNDRFAALETAFAAERKAYKSAAP